MAIWEIFHEILMLPARSLTETITDPAGARAAGIAGDPPTWASLLTPVPRAWGSSASFAAHPPCFRH